MDELDNATYYLRREGEERALAALSLEPAVRLAHLQLADRYVACFEAALVQARANLQGLPTQPAPNGANFDRVLRRLDSMASGIVPRRQSAPGG